MLELSMTSFSWAHLDRGDRRRVVIWSICSSVLVFAAIGCLVGAILLATLGRREIDNVAKEEATLEPGHTSYEQFQSPTLPMWKSIYFFNLTNPEGFQAGEMPALEEIGPYSYREYREKYILNTSDDDTQLTYNQSKTFYYDQDNSAEAVMENDTICTINIPLVGAVGAIDMEDIVSIQLLKSIFNETDAQLHICLPARELVWNFTTDLLQALHNNPILQFINAEPPEWISIQANQSINGSEPSIVYTGVGDISQVGQFIQWNGHYRKLEIWPEETANCINGTEGIVFEPLHGHEPLEVFSEDALRSFPLTYKDNAEHYGLKTHRYEVPLSVYESAFTNPENARWGSWNPDGMFYVGVTQTPPAPVFSSKPHFLDGDKILLEKVSGLSPNRQLHDTIIEVESISGGNIQFKQQFQINFQVNQTTAFEQLANINGTLYYPVLYVNEHAELTEDFADYLKESGLDEYHLAEVLVWVFFSLLLLAVIVSTTVAIAGGVLCAKVLVKSGKEDEQVLLMTPTTQSPTRSPTFKSESP